MKVRIGYATGLGSATAEPARLAALVDGLEARRFDSLWLPERVGADTVDPVVGLAYAAARTTRLKLGTSVLILPGRSPALLAKELASLDRLSGGRFLPAFGLGAVRPAEQQAFGVRREDRSSVFDEALPLVRRFWTGEEVTHHGRHFSYDAVRVRPVPVQTPPEVWLGGQAASELRRVGRLGDGWLPSFCTPSDVAAGRLVVEAEAAAHARTIDPEHFGVLVPYSRAPLTSGQREQLAARRPGRPARPVEEYVPVGLPAVRALLGEFVDAGASKFVLLPLAEPADWDAELDDVAAEVLPMQTGATAAAARG